ncbi:gene transfer agent family protein [Devosia sp. A449]
MNQFFGDAEYEFKLTRPMVLELERTTGTGIGALCRKVFGGHFHLTDITETIRLALIGAGLDPEKAKTLADTYSTTPSLVHGHALAVSALEEFYAGTPAGETKEPAKND